MRFKEWGLVGYDNKTRQFTPLGKRNKFFTEAGARKAADRILPGPEAVRPIEESIGGYTMRHTVFIENPKGLIHPVEPKAK